MVISLLQASVENGEDLILYLLHSHVFVVAFWPVEKVVNEKRLALLAKILQTFTCLFSFDREMALKIILVDYQTHKEDFDTPGISMLNKKLLKLIFKVGNQHI